MKLYFHADRTAGSKIAGACDDGLWKDLKAKLLNGQTADISCEACIKVMNEKHYSCEDHANFAPEDSMFGPDEVQDKGTGNNCDEDAGTETTGKKKKRQPVELDDLVLDALAKKISAHLQVSSALPFACIIK